MKRIWSGFVLAATVSAFFLPARPLAASNLVFVPIAPCRIIDTRCPPGSTCSAFRIVHGSPAISFLVHGATADYRAQGGTASGCGIPDAVASQNVAQAIAVNLIAVSAAGAGDLRAWPADQSKPAASVLNFSSSLATGGLNIANGLILPICHDLTAPGCSNGDLNVSADASDAYLVADVTGYFTAENAEITELDPGTGLTGGGSGGILSLGLLTAYQLPQGCAGGQQPGWSGGAWVCQTPASGSVVIVGSGAGLTGGPITSTGTLSVATGGITSAMLANGAVGLAQIDSSQVQTRISSTCSPGSTIQAIHADGSVVCTGVSPLAGPTLSVVDGTGDVGRYPSITIGADGLGLVSYYDYTNNTLKVAHCSDTACTSANVSTIALYGQRSSITISADGLGLVSYYDLGWGYLKVAHCWDVACTSSLVSTLDTTIHAGTQSSIAAGADGLALIGYSGTSNTLRVAHCSDTGCTSAALSQVYNPGSISFPSVAIGADRVGLISYYDATNGQLKVAHCLSAYCDYSSYSILDSAATVGQYTSITIGADGLGLISYYDSTNGDLKAAHCVDVACTGASVSTLDSTGDVGQYTSIAIGVDGLGLISYYDVTNGDLKVAHCSNVACTGATVSTVDSTGDVGKYASIAIGADGLGLISYYDATNGDLKVAHCSNVFCTPYVRRR